MKIKNKLFKEMTQSQKVENEELFCEILLNTISEYYEIDYDYVKNKTRKREIVFARQVGMYLLMKNLEYGPTRAGKCFDKDHATALHAFRQVKDLLSVNKKINKDVKNIEDIVISKMEIFANKRKPDSSYYYINLDEYVSFKTSETKAILFTGYSDIEINEILTSLKVLDSPSFKHKNTGSYILEKLTNDNNTRDTTSFDSSN